MGINSANFAFYGDDNATFKGGSFILAKAIEDIENSFLHEKEGRLYKFLLEVIEKPLIENILHKTEGNQLKAAKILGINRNTLHTKIKKLKINIVNFKKGGLKMS